MIDPSAPTPAELEALDFLLQWAFTLLLGASVLWSLGIFFALVYFRARPHRGKIFISYSHRDTKTVESLLQHFASYHFRTWVDVGITIPSDRLRDTLSGRIKGTKIFLLVASANSVASPWVDFERDASINLSAGLGDAWRDTVILALDEPGLQVYETFRTLYDERVFAYFANSFPTKTSLEIAEAVAAMREVGTRQVFLRRTFVPTVTLIDFRESFDAGVEALTEYLQKNTLMGRVQPEKRNRFRILLLGCFLFYGLLTLLFLYLLVLVWRD
jgi:hypothetical protein